MLLQVAKLYLVRNQEYDKQLKKKRFVEKFHKQSKLRGVQ